MHPDVAAVIEELDDQRARFERFCRALSAEELARPVPASSWLVRDFIAHLATIDEPVTAMFQRVHRGLDGVSAEHEAGRWDIDAWNDARVLERREASVESLLAEASVQRAQIKGVMAQFSDRDLEFVMTFGGDGKRPAGKVQFLAYLRGWCKHDAMHAVDMMRALPERWSPEIEGWFDDPAVRGYQKAMNPAV